MMAISKSRATSSEVSPPSGATGSATIIARISSARRVSPRICVKIEKTFG
jgi:hypothetical protein